MALPKQVEQQMLEVAELEKQMAAKPEPELGEAPEAAEQPADTSTPPAAEVTPTTPVEPRNDEETWEQRYKTLAGMYKAEVAREINAQMAEARRAIQNLQSQLDAQERKEPVSGNDKLVTDQDVDKFGDDLIDLQRRVAREVAAEFTSAINNLTQENAQLREQMSRQGSQVQSLSFEQQLATSVPDFRQINADARWVSWLNEIDPMIMAPRRVVAQQAFDEGNVEAIGHYVALFKSTLAQPTPQIDRQSELARQVTPSRSASASAASTQSAKVYTNADIERMFAKVRDHSIAQRHEQAAKLEAEINAAYMEGRVRA